MASLLRSAKPGNQWTTNELIAFNIDIQDVEFQTFFGIDELPKTSVSTVILENDRESDGPITKEERLFFRYLRHANVAEESAVDDFALHLLRIMDFDGGQKSLHTKKEMSFEMCGERVYAKPDICIMDRADLLLLVQEDKVRSVDCWPHYDHWLNLPAA